MMTKQEEIREGMESILTEDLIMKSITRENAPPGKDCYDDCGVIRGRDGNKKHKKCMVCWEEYIRGLALRILKKEASQGLVIKVDRELPPKYFANRKKMPWITDYDVEVCAQQDMLKAGYVAVEPLIKDDE